MLGFKPGLYWRICWKFISPSFIIVSKILNIIKFKIGSYFKIILISGRGYIWAIVSSTTAISTVYVSVVGRMGRMDFGSQLSPHDTGYGDLSFMFNTRNLQRSKTIQHNRNHLIRFHILIVFSEICIEYIPNRRARSYQKDQSRQQILLETLALCVRC